MSMAYHLRQPSNYWFFKPLLTATKRYRKQLNEFAVRARMGDVGACWDNTVVGRFFRSLKCDWIFKIAQLLTRESI